LHEKYPEVAASPQQLTQYGLKLIGDQAAKILCDGNRKQDLIIGYVKHLDSNVTTLTNYLMQGRKKSVRKAISRLNNASDSSVQQQLQTLSMNAVDNDDDDEDEDDEEMENGLQDDVDEGIDVIEETDAENMDPNPLLSPSQYSLAGAVRSNKRKRQAAISKKQAVAPTKAGKSNTTGK